MLLIHNMRYYAYQSLVWYASINQEKRHTWCRPIMWNDRRLFYNNFDKFLNDNREICIVFILLRFPSHLFSIDIALSISIYCSKCNNKNKKIKIIQKMCVHMHNNISFELVAISLTKIYYLNDGSFDQNSNNKNSYSVIARVSAFQWISKYIYQCVHQMDIFLFTRFSIQLDT